MDFIKQMKKREFIEMGLKTLAALLAVFLAIILMEGMIYSIQLHSLAQNTDQSTTVQSHTVAYCIDQKDDNYLVVFHYEDKENDINHWSSAIKSEEDCTKEALNVREVVFKAPNAFELSIEGYHFIIMGVLVAAVGGYFTYRFIRLNQSYKKIEEQFLKDGTIEISNV